MALAPSSFEDSIASSDLDFSDGFDELSSSHTSPMNRTYDDPGHDPPALPSIAQPLAPWEDGSSMIDHEFSDLDIQTLFAVVQRAQDVLPTLPAHSRRPVPALFKAYYEILPQRGIDPEDDQQIAKLIFKLGGVKTGGSLEEKFTAVMSRMGIELQLEDLQSQASDTEGENAQMPDLPSLDQDHHDHVYKMHETEPDAENDTMVPEPTYTGLSVITEESHTHSSTYEVEDHSLLPEEPVAAIDEQDLHEAAAAFHDEHKFVFPVTTAFSQWHSRASFASHILAQFQLARQADLEDDVQDKFQEWRSVAIEAKEVPLYELPGNIFSKQTEQVAVRAREIYALKCTLHRWRQKTRRATSQGASTSTTQADLMQRVATKAHNNLMLSRTFTQWYNRAEEEASKERLARHAYESNLKAKIFDARPRVAAVESKPVPDSGEQETRARQTRAGTSEARGKSAVDSLPQKAPDTTSANPRMNVASGLELDQKHKGTAEATRRESFQHQDAAGQSKVASEARKEREEERRKAEERRSALKARTLSLIRALSERTQNQEGSTGDEDPAMSSEVAPDADGNTEVTVVRVEDELDERTLIARRHILRMRYFTAWEDYSKHHLTLVDTFERRKVVESWRQHAAKAPERLQHVQQRVPELRRRTFRKWMKRVRTNEQLVEKADWVYKRSRVSQAILQWLAQSRQRQRSTMLKRRTLSAWYDQPMADATLAACADKFHHFQQVASTFNSWRRAAAREALACDRLEQYGARAGYYYAATGVLRAWKAVAKETSRKTAAKKAALDNWGTTSQQELERQGILQEYAERAIFYNGVVKVLPKWRARAKEICERRQAQESYCQRANYYYSTKGSLEAWRAAAKAKRKQRLRDAYLETRRIVKKGSGERAVRTWYQRLEPQLRRTEMMNETLDHALGERKWRQSMHAVQVWRERAAQKQAIIDDQHTAAKHQAMTQWQLLAEERQELAYGARAHWEDSSCTKALKRWNLRRDQNAGRPLMVAYALEKKDRRMVRHGLEQWYAKTAEHHLSLEAAEEQNTVSQLGVSTFEEAIADSHGKSPARSEGRWRASLKEGIRTEDIYVPTPGRPSLMLGDLGFRNAALTTTPLGPVPRRSWHPDTHESSMRGSALGGQGSRAARKNLRVSFAR